MESGDIAGCRRRIIIGILRRRRGGRHSAVAASATGTAVHTQACWLSALRATRRTHPTIEVPSELALADLTSPAPTGWSFYYRLLDQPHIFLLDANAYEASNACSSVEYRYLVPHRQFEKRLSFSGKRCSERLLRMQPPILRSIARIAWN